MTRSYLKVRQQSSLQVSSRIFFRPGEREAVDEPHPQEMTLGNDSEPFIFSSDNIAERGRLDA